MIKKNKLFFNIFNYILYLLMGIWNLFKWGLGIGDWAQSPIPNPQSPIPNINNILLLK